MKFARRQFLHFAAGGVALSAAPGLAWTQGYPSRPVRIIVGFAPGGGSDILARLLGRWLAERFGHPFIIENRAGAATNIATEMVAKATPDGHTLLLIGGAAAINATLYDNLHFDLLRDIAPVASIMRQPNVMVVNPSFPAKTVFEFIRYAAFHPGKINMASGGNGSGAHVAGELFKMMTGVELVHVPYRGEGPALTDLLGGQVDVMFGTLPAAIGQIRSGKLRALAVTTATRSEVLPDVPTVDETLPGYEASSLYGVGAPRGAPAQVVKALNKEINGALADPNFKMRLADLGGTVVAGQSADFGGLLAGEVAKWAKVIKFAGIKSV